MLIFGELREKSPLLEIQIKGKGTLKMFMLCWIALVEGAESMRYLQNSPSMNSLSLTDRCKFPDFQYFLGY